MDYSSQILVFEIFRRFSILHIFIWPCTTDNIFHHYIAYARKIDPHIILTHDKIFSLYLQMESNILFALSPYSEIFSCKKDKYL